jgi:hypothetical protein
MNEEEDKERQEEKKKKMMVSMLNEEKKRMVGRVRGLAWVMVRKVMKKEVRMGMRGM